jgi:hypothetical protein
MDNVKLSNQAVLLNEVSKFKECCSEQTVALQIRKSFLVLHAVIVE